MKQTLLQCLLFCIVNLSVSQELSNSNKITGSIYAIENQSKTALSFASVRLLSAKDSSFIIGTTTNSKGQFELISSREKKQLILVSCMGYESIYEQVPSEKINSSFLMKDIILLDKSIKLNETVVLGQRAEMVIKKDTVEYNSAAYRLKSNAVAEDLLKKLPGITITDEGTILVNGKEVKRVMVDGKDFFRSNPNLTIKNIPASIMEKLQIINDKSELTKLTGIEDGEESIAINITIQKEKKKGWLVSSNIGEGKELQGNEGDLLRHTVNCFAARLVESSQLGVLANGNNVNGMSMGSGASTVGIGKPGLNSSLSGGINYSSGKDNHAPWMINSDVSYGYNERVLRSNSIRRYFLQDSSSYQTDTLKQFSSEQSLRFSSKIENNSIHNWVFSFSPSASITSKQITSEGKSLLQAGNINRDSVNANRYNTYSNIPVLDFGEVFIITHDFEKKRRKVAINFDSRYTNKEGVGEIDASYQYYRNNAVNKQVKQQQWKNQSLFINRQFHVLYIEPIGLKNSIQLVYWIRYNTNNNIINNFNLDSLSGQYSRLDLPLSRSLNNNILTQQMRINYSGIVNNFTYTMGVDINDNNIQSLSFIQKASISGKDSALASLAKVRNFNIVPNVNLMYDIGPGAALRFDYKGRPESPSISQLDPSRNESNPTNIRIGNPNLTPKFTHWARIRFNTNQREKQQSFQMDLEGNYVVDDIVDRTIFDGTTGIKTTTPVNQTGSWNANGVVMYSKPFLKYFQVNNNLQSGLRNIIGFTSLNNANSSEKNTATSIMVNDELGLSYKWEWLYLMSKASYLLNSTTYSMHNLPTQHNASFGGFFSAQVSLPDTWSIASGLNYRKLSGYSSSYNRNELLWNIELSKSFLENKAGTLTLLMNDILQQQLNISQVIASNYIEEQQFNTLKSLVMLAFSYRFNSMGK